MTTKEKAEKLSLWARAEGTEVGDFWEELSNLYNYQSDYYSDDFFSAIEDEIAYQYKYALELIEEGEIEV